MADLVNGSKSTRRIHKLAHKLGASFSLIPSLSKGFKLAGSASGAPKLATTSSNLRESQIDSQPPQEQSDRNCTSTLDPIEPKPDPLPGLCAPDSGYGSLASTPSSTTVHEKARSKTALKVFPKKISTEVHNRFNDLRVLHAPALLEAVAKTKPPNISMKLKYLGESEETAKLYIVVQCDSEIVKKVERFFSQKHVLDDLASDFLVDVRGGTLLSLLGAMTFDISGSPDSRVTFCGMPIIISNGDARRRATFGGLVYVQMTRKRGLLYGVTAAHPAAALVPQSMPGADVDDKSLDSKEPGQPLFDTSTRVGMSQQVEESDALLSESRNLGTITESGLLRRGDLALIELACSEVLPNCISSVLPAVVGEDVLPKSRNLFAPTHQKHSFQDWPAALLTSRGLQHGQISSSRSAIITSVDVDFVEMFDFCPNHGAELTPGDSGSWVVNLLTGEVYGHVVSTDAFGEASVIPVQTSLAVMKEQLHARDVRLPTANQISNLQVKQEISASVNVIQPAKDHAARYEEAARMNRRALNNREKVLGPEHSDTLTSTTNLASTYQNQADAFPDDSRTIVSASANADGTIRDRDVATGACTTTLEEHSAPPAQPQSDFTAKAKGKGREPRPKGYKEAPRGLKKQHTTPAQTRRAEHPDDSAPAHNSPEPFYQRPEATYVYEHEFPIILHHEVNAGPAYGASPHHTAYVSGLPQSLDVDQRYGQAHGDGRHDGGGGGGGGGEPKPTDQKDLAHPPYPSDPGTAAFEATEVEEQSSIYYHSAPAHQAQYVSDDEFHDYLSETSPSMTGGIAPSYLAGESFPMVITPRDPYSAYGVDIGARETPRSDDWQPTVPGDYPNPATNAVRKGIDDPNREPRLLDSKYVTLNLAGYRVAHPTEFRPGEIFKVMWAEARGTRGETLSEGTATSQDSGIALEDSGMAVYQGIRRFIVIANDEGHCTVVPILTYERRGCNKRGVKPMTHGIIHQMGKQPHKLSGEPDLGFRPVRAILDASAEFLAKESRVNYAKFQSVEHNVPVFFIGRVHPKDYENIVRPAVDYCWERKGRIES